MFGVALKQLGGESKACSYGTSGEYACAQKPKQNVIEGFMNGGCKEEDKAQMHCKNDAYMCKFDFEKGTGHWQCMDMGN